MTILFWLLIVLILYHYCVFPLLTVAWGYFQNLIVKKEAIFPHVTLIVAAYNEEKVIKRKIENSFALNYPKDKLEIIFVSDGSTDATPEIVADYHSQGVVSLFSPPRRGKTSALNRAVAAATGDIIVFSDANSMYQPDAIARLTANFADTSVGGVCGRKSIVQNSKRESSKGDSLFWYIESFIKIQQSTSKSINSLSKKFPI